MTIVIKLTRINDRRIQIKSVLLSYAEFCKIYGLPVQIGRVLYDFGEEKAEIFDIRYY